MLSIQAVRGLPRLRALGIVPCLISFAKQLPCFLMVRGIVANIVSQNSAIIIVSLILRESYC